MNSSDYRVTALLTEHLGFAPLTLVDEVINAVNKIMYNCFDALETFLTKRRDAQLERLRRDNGIGEGDADIDTNGLMDEKISAAEERGEVFPLAEIHHGTSELETLLVSHVDRNFDKFELYTLRNILTMPRDLVEDGWVRLKHHEHLDNLDLTETQAGKGENIASLLKNISYELQLRKVLQAQLSKAQKLVGLLSRYKNSIDALISTHSNTQLSADSIRKLKEGLTPMNENVYYLISQSRELIDQVSRLTHTLAEDQMHFRPNNRDIYLHEKTLALIQSLTSRRAN
ncbi:hypothetical protein OXX80_012061 [Metschnikowia pulcherrima]